MDPRFLVRLSSALLAILCIVLLAVSVNNLRINHQSRDDVEEAHRIVASLYNSTSPTQPNIPVPFEQLNELNLRLFAANERWEIQVTSSIAVITIICVCLIFEGFLFLYPFRVCTTNENNDKDNNSYNSDAMMT